MVAGTNEVFNPVSRGEILRGPGLLLPDLLWVGAGSNEVLAPLNDVLVVRLRFPTI